MLMILAFDQSYLISQILKFLWGVIPLETPFTCHKFQKKKIKKRLFLWNEKERGEKKERVV